MRDPLLIVGDVRNEDPLAGRADATDLPLAQRKAPECAGEPRPVRATIERRARARGQVETPSLVGTLSPQRAGRADVAGADEPDARQCHGRPLSEAVDDLRQHAIDRSLRGDGKRHGLEGLGVHDRTLYNEPSRQSSERSL